MRKEDFNHSALLPVYPCKESPKLKLSTMSDGGY